MAARGHKGALKRTLTGLIEGKCDRGLALSVALLGHFALACFFWAGGGARAGSIASESGEGSTITVDFVAISPRAPTIPSATLDQARDVASKADSSAASEADAAPVESTLAPEGDQPASANTAGGASMHEQGRSSDNPAQASPRAEASSNATPSSGPKGEEGEATNDGLEGRYIAALKQSVAAHWTARGRKAGGTCTLTIHQVPGGQVQSAISGACALDEEGRRALEAAALMAQPLPYRGFETVFREDIELEFNSN